MKRTIFLILSFLFLSTTFKSDSIKTYGWYQQSFPNLNGSSIKDITFLDSLTGFAVTSPDASDNGYILKTSNGGDNWNNIYTYPPPNGNVGFTRIKFATDNIGYASTDYTQFFKTTNAGLSWNNISSPPWSVDDMCVLNKDAILFVTSSSFAGGVYRSTNGGVNWQLIWTNGTSGNPSKIYMYDKNMGYIQDGNNSYNMRRTTNGGFNWAPVTGEKFTSIKFYDNNTGWKVYDSLKKTTDGGISWITQRTPKIGNHFDNFTSFSILNENTVWMAGRRNFTKPPIYKTTNGGLNWGYQIPDSNLQIYSFHYLQFINQKTGWTLPLGNYLSTYLYHTTSGGNDTTFFTGIKLVPNLVPEMFSLGQNYPNPFNPTTNIPFELKEPSHITLKVYDVRGREIKELVNGRWGTGKFIADFDAADFPTGVYFYKIVISGETTKQTFSETKRMLMIK